MKKAVILALLVLVVFVPSIYAQWGHNGYGYDELQRAHHMRNHGDCYDARRIFQNLSRNGDNDDIRREACYYIGFCSVKLSDSWQAISDYRDFLSRYDGSWSTKYVPDALFVLGRTYEVVGNNSDARYYYKKCIDRFPYDNYAKLSRDRLRVIDGGYYVDNNGGYNDGSHHGPHFSLQTGKVAKTTAETSLAKTNPYEDLNIDCGQISRVNKFIQAVNKLEGVESAVQNLADSDKNLDSVKETLKVLSEKQKFESLHLNSPVK